MIDPKEGLYEHAQFDGLRNNVPADRLALGDLTVATNVDIDDSKRVSRRTGHSAAVLAGAYKSLWSNGATALAVKAETSLVQIHPALTESVLRTGLTPGLDMSYTSPAALVYYSNGRETGVVEDSRSRTWGLAPPVAQPAASATGGVLPAGRYQFAVTYLRRDGQESGTPRASSIDLTDIGGISFSSIAVSSDPDVAHKALYISKVNGQDLYRAGVIANGDTTFKYHADAFGTVPLWTQHLLPPPAGQVVGSFAGGYTLVGAGDTLYYSEPLALELFDYRKNLRFASPITMIADMDDGVYIGTQNQVLWLNGSDPQKWALTPKLSYGAIRGAMYFCSRDMVDADGKADEYAVFFATTQGLCVGMNGGSVSNVTQSRFSYPVQERGAALVRRHRGMVQGLVTLQGAVRAGNTAS